jgi:choice-of-anchor A domain-containing protein/LPXTG-motif cell wall-anchored protein
MKLFNGRMIKKVFAVVFAFVMIFAQAVSVHAEEKNGFPGWECDWAEIDVNGKNEFYQFNNTLTADDLNSIAAKTGKAAKIGEGIKLEYHYIDSTEEQFVNSQYYNSNYALGVAGNFHIVAFGTAHLNAHTNGNVLCNNLEANVNFGTKNYSEVTAYANTYSKVAASLGTEKSNPLIVGNSVSVTLADNDNAFAVNGTKMDHVKVIYRDSTDVKYIDIASAEKEITSISNELASRSNTANIVADQTDRNKTSFTLTDPDGVAVINLKAQDIKNLSSNTVIAGFKSGHNASVVINVDCENQDIKLPDRLLMSVDGQQQGTGEVTDFSCGRILWNFKNCKDKTITAGQMTGTIIALGATVSLTSNLNGSVIAENTMNGGETHRTDFIGKLYDDRTSFTVSKEFKDNNWPAGTAYNVTLTAENGAPLPENTSLSLTSTDNKKSFGTIVYPYAEAYQGSTEDYVYDIQETKGNVANVTYSDTVYQVKVSVEYKYDAALNVKSATIVNRQYSTDGGKTWNAISSNFGTFKFVNTYTETESPKGSLTISKTFEGASLTDDQKNNVSFTITGDNYSKTVTYKEFTNGSYTLSDLKVGDYTVSESNADVEGYTHTAAYSVKDGKTAVTAGKTSAVNVTNTYTEKGNLIIQKTISGEDLTEDNYKNLTFEISKDNTVIKTVALEDFTKNEDGTYTYAMNHVDNGTYSVKETNAEIEGYNVVISYTVNGSEGSSADVTENKTSQIDIKDSYTKRPTTPITPDTPTPTPSAPTTPVTPAAPTTPTTTDRPNTPNTGDQTNAGIAAGAFGFSMMIAGLTFFFKKKYSA